MTAPGSGPLDAALLQLGEHRERIDGLDKREHAHYKATQEQLADVLVRLAALRGMLGTQAEALESLRGLEGAVKQLAARLEGNRGGNENEEGDKYEPIPVVRWWEFTRAELGEERKQEHDTAAARLRAWVKQIYKPLYGHLAAQLGDCWEAHPLALVTLDWLSELWSVLYLTAGRDARQLGQQAELGTRILPAAAQMLADETRGCERHSSPVNGYPVPGAVRR